jgi:outer membrane protein OmpA-like peptidoglycan-associated protein
MKQLIFGVLSVSLITACQTGPKNPPLYKPGEIAFGSIANLNEEQYLLEQDALFRRKLTEKGVSSELLDKRTIELNIPGNIAFAINSASMNWNLHDVLDEIVGVIREYQHSSILIIGHSDARGNKIVNQLLSQQRAKAIYDYFIRSDINAARLSYAGVGASDLLIEDDLTTLDRALNRRLTLKITVDRDPDVEKSGLVNIAPIKATDPIDELQKATDLSDVTILDDAEEQLPSVNIEEEINSSDGFIDLK